MAKKIDALYVVKAWKMSAPDSEGARTRIGNGLNLNFVDADLAQDAADALRRKGYGVEFDRFGATIFRDMYRALESVDALIG